MIEGKPRLAGKGNIVVSMCKRCGVGAPRWRGEKSGGTPALSVAHFRWRTGDVEMIADILKCLALLMFDARANGHR